MRVKTFILPVFVLLGIIITSDAALAEVRSKALTYQDDGATLTGYLYWDDAVKARRPAVLVVHEWWGLNDYAKHRAEMLAKAGYVAFAMDMYGDKRVTEHAPEAQAWMEQITANVDAWRRRAMAALALIRSRPEVDPQSVAAIGYCFGGATVMQMAYAGADLKGVVSFHGSLPPAQGVQKGSIKPDILAAHGAADAFVPPERVREFQKSLDDAGATWTMAVYSGARHGFTNPDAGKFGIANIEYNARADAQSWQLMLDFLKGVFRKKP